MPTLRRRRRTSWVCALNSKRLKARPGGPIDPSPAIVLAAIRLPLLALPTALSPLNAKNEEREGTSWRRSRNPPDKSDKVFYCDSRASSTSSRTGARRRSWRKVTCRAFEYAERTSTNFMMSLRPNHLGISTLTSFCPCRVTDPSHCAHTNPSLNG